MMPLFTVPFKFDLGDLGTHYGQAEGHVDVRRSGGIFDIEIVTVKLASAFVSVISKDGLKAIEIDPLPFLDESTKLSIEEAIEERYHVFKSKGGAA